jgi:alcohol dehydrogenase
MIAVPTTAGTGSETQSFALISDPVTHQKMACGDPKAAFCIALLDPELTLSQPDAVTAATGTDAIVHAVETFVTRRRNPLSMVFARESWRLLQGSLEKVLENPGDLDARGRMQLGASYAGMAIENSMLGATHSAANPLTARYGTVHGVAVGMLLPHVVRWNAAVVDEEYRELARLGALRHNGNEMPGEPLASHVESLFARTGLPRTLSECGVTPDAIPELAEEAAGQWTAQFNPRRLSTQDFEALYRCAL